MKRVNILRWNFAALWVFLHGSRLLIHSQTHIQMLLISDAILLISHFVRI
jgi:hypothetical protein